MKDTTWIMSVQAGVGYTMSSGQKQIGSADIVHKLQFRDCIVSGIALYTPTTLAILAYRTRDDDDRPIQQTQQENTPRKGRHRHTSLAPQLRLVNAINGEELDVDELPISRFETLSAQDYHLSSLLLIIDGLEILRLGLWRTWVKRIVRGRIHAEQSGVIVSQTWMVIKDS